MKEKLENKLYEKYPKIFRQKDLDMSQTCMCWGISCGDGWFDLIDTLCEKIQNYCDQGYFIVIKDWYYYYLKIRGFFYYLRWKIFKKYQPLKIPHKKKVKRFQVEAIQVKEKFGGLRVYTNGNNEYIEGLISMACEMSYLICEFCGTTKNVLTEPTWGWDLTLCKKCRKKYIKQRKENLKNILNK